jgi:cytoskeletal protein RodZ
MSKWAIAGAWVIVAALATGLTWQIVSAADAQVSERPPLQAALAPSTSESTTSIPTSTTATAAPSSSSPGTTPSTGSSSSPAPPVTQGAFSSRTIQTGGGVVVVTYRPNEVLLGSASPAAGFAAEIKKAGPPEVDVEFENESADYRVRARWVDGDLSVETESDVD